MSSERIDETAADWFARLLSPDCTERDRDAFEAWCAQSEAHADAFAAVAQCHADAAVLKNDERMRAGARAARYAVSARMRHRRPARLAGFAAAAALVLAVGAGVLWTARSEKTQSFRYATTVGEQRRVELADGTHVQLDTDTQLDVRFDASSRELRLDRGRIDIEVAADAKRPFSVRSGRGVVHDIGTQFQVARYGGDVTVTLLSGLVSVALAEPASPQENRVLAPGEELHIGDRGDLGWPTRVDLDVVSGWTRGVLTFKDRRLGDLLDEMNRYSETKIRIADPALSSLVVSGVFRTGDQSSLLQALRAGWSIRSRHVSDREIELSHE